MSVTKLHLDIPTELKTNLKIVAAKQNRTMKEIVIELITEYVEKNK